MKNLPKEDKLKHNYVGMWIATLSVILSISFVMLFNAIFNTRLRLYLPGVSVTFTLIAGLYKEWKDSKDPDMNVELMDVVHTVLPGVLIAFVIEATLMYTHHVQAQQ